MPSASLRFADLVVIAGAPTRSHSEHGREMPQRQWYFVSRRGRVGRCQVCKTQHNLLNTTKRPLADTKGRQKRPFVVPDNENRQTEHINFGQAKYPRVGKPNALGAGWSSPVARQAHNLKAAGSNPAPATKFPAYKTHSRKQTKN